MRIQGLNIVVEVCHMHVPLKVLHRDHAPVVKTSQSRPVGEDFALKFLVLENEPNVLNATFAFPLLVIEEHVKIRAWDSCGKVM